MKARAGRLRHRFWLPGLALALAGLTLAPAQELSARVPFKAGEHLLMMPALTITFARLTVEPGEVRRGRQRVKITVVGANVAEEDYRADLEIILLDAGGEEIARQTERKGIEEGEVGKVKVRFDLDTGRVREIGSISVKALISRD